MHGLLQTAFQAALTFIVSVWAGTRIAHVWQIRAAKENRFFEASRDIFQQMAKANDALTSLIGRRIYAIQRLCRAQRGSAEFSEALIAFKAITIEWNERLLEMELAINTLFRNSHLLLFERLQQKLAAVSGKVTKFADGDETISRTLILREIEVLRSEYFSFAKGMLEEAKLLRRQMHFGVRIQNNFSEIEKMSTKDLIKTLIASRVEGQSVIRSPSDFGEPISIRSARFGINE